MTSGVLTTLAKATDHSKIQEQSISRGYSPRMKECHNERILVEEVLGRDQYLNVV